MWDYADANRITTLKAVTAVTCIFCHHHLLRIPSMKFEVKEKALLCQASICKACGWWCVYRVHQGEYEETANVAESYSGTVGSLKELDLVDISTPLREVRQYLLAKEDSIFDAHPRLFENVVASVFSDLGWNARVTAYSGDQGVDVVLDGPDNKTVGVQVKRYRSDRRIEAEQIRSFAGALLLNGHTKGVFVATSPFRKGAQRAAREFATIGYPIELVDAKKFLNALGVAQISSFKIDRERVASLFLRTGLHVGTGLHKEFTPGEDLRLRPVVLQTFAREEFIREEDDGNENHLI